MEADFYGFDPSKVLFMVQKAFHGLNLGPQGWFYDTAAPRRLHNHGQMLMQSTMDHQGVPQPQRGQEAPGLAPYRNLLRALRTKFPQHEDLDY